MELAIPFRFPFRETIHRSQNLVYLQLRARLPPEDDTDVSSLILLPSLRELVYRHGQCKLDTSTSLGVIFRTFDTPSLKKMEIDSSFLAVDWLSTLHDVRGFLIQWLLWPIGRHDMTSVEPYVLPHNIARYGLASKISYLKRSLPRREPGGQRPFVDSMWVAPQRQEGGSQPTDSPSIREVCRKSSFLNKVPLWCLAPGVLTRSYQNQDNLLESIVGDSKNLRIAQSQQEGHGSAIFLSEDLKPASWAVRTKGEIAHFHLEDGSGHVSLTPLDAAEVVEKGWGQRHALSHFIHIGFTMIYAPRTQEQLEVVREIYEAACAGMVDGAMPV